MIGSVGTVAEAVAMYDANRPDVIVTDLQLEDGTGLDIIRQVRAHDEKIGLVVVTMHSGDDQIFAAMQAGAADGISSSLKANADDYASIDSQVDQSFQKINGYLPGSAS